MGFIEMHACSRAAGCVTTQHRPEFREEERANQPFISLLLIFNIEKQTRYTQRLATDTALTTATNTAPEPVTLHIRLRGVAGPVVLICSVLGLRVSDGADGCCQQLPPLL